MFCPKCGTPCTGQKRFCSKCGATLNSSAAASTPSGDVAPAAPNAKKKVRPLFIILPCILLVAIALTLFFALRGGSGGSEETVDPFRDIPVYGELDTDKVVDLLGSGVKFETDYGEWGILYENFNYLGVKGNLEFYVKPSSIYPTSLRFYYFSSGYTEDPSKYEHATEYTATEAEKEIARKNFEKLSDHFTQLYGEPSYDTDDQHLSWCKAVHNIRHYTEKEIITIDYYSSSGYICIECKSTG